MGSSGTGRLSDYPGTGGNGKQSPEDRCERAFSTALEDVEHSEYFQNQGEPPPVQTQLRLRRRKRIVAETFDGQSVGNVPTGLNYLASCLNDGWEYTGLVTHSNNDPPSAEVAADFAPSSPS